ncbi:hypothetical protein FOL47_008239 [Perkinsus chesapeaki]|uniref:Pentatricopeptide repeat-containing protein n=1 Tax=Perkinsus chesapeaki TaxID=330153 RepID=A0A7J6LFA6_PERCH|nr:hypothetical protein FOL47_008239 [Perkinsus chesapeaki]
MSPTVGHSPSPPPESLTTPKGTAQSEDATSARIGTHSLTNKSPFRSPWSPSGTTGFGSSTDSRQLQGSGLYESLLFGASDTASGAEIPSYGQHKSMELNLETALADDPSVASSALAMSRSGGSMWQATTPLEKGATFGGGASTSRLSSEKFWGSPGSLPPSRPYGQVPDTPLSSSRGLYSSGKFPGAVTLSPEARVWTPSTIDSHYLSPQRPYDPTSGALSAAPASSPEALLPGSPPGWSIPDLSTHEEANHGDYTTATDPSGAAPSTAFGARVLEGPEYNWIGEMASQGDMSAAMDSLMQQAALLASSGTAPAVANSASHQQAMLALLLSSTALQMQLVAASGGINGNRSTTGSAQRSLASPPPPPSFPPPGLSSSESSRVNEASDEHAGHDWKETKENDVGAWSVKNTEVDECEDKLSSRLRVASDRDNAEASSIIKECGRRGDIRSCWKVWNHLVTTGQCLSNWRGRGGENRSRGNGEASSPSSSPGAASIYRPNEITLGCMTDALVSNRLVEEAEQLVGEWKELIPPNTVIYSTLIHGWAKQNDANRARSIFALMREENVLCNAVTFNCLIHACVRVGDMQGALELLDAMKLQAASATAPTDDGGGINDNNSNGDPSCEQGSDNTAGRGGGGGLMVPLPDKFTYSTIIKGYCARGEMEQSLQMFDTMLNDGLQPDLVIYNTLLDGCVKRRYHGTCERLLDDMTNYWKIQPNSYTLSILIKHYGRQGDLERAFKLVEELPAKHGFEANAHVWTCLISACITHGEMETAQAIFDVMRKVKPSRRQQGNDNGGFDSPNPALATPTILRMAAKCAPDAKAYETQIHGWMKYNRQDRVKELTEDLERKFGMPGYSRPHHHHHRGSRRG